MTSISTNAALLIAFSFPILCAPSEVTIVKTATGFQLMRNGKPYFIKGAVADHNYSEFPVLVGTEKGVELLLDGKPYVGRGADKYFDQLAAAGGNSVRARPQVLDEAQKRGFAVLANIVLGKPRHGFNYNDAEACARQAEQVRQVVLRYKDHPALLMWSLGNELNVRAKREEQLPIWKEVNRLAAMVKQIDGRHPVLTVVGAVRGMLDDIDQLCPELDLIGLNAYADMMTLPEDVARVGWKRPYVITEYGPMGHWQVPKTPWGQPKEQSSTEKAQTYMAAYRHAVEGRPNCLGSYVFHWEWHQEKTHTWYGMFLADGSRTEAIDVITFLYSGKWPANRCPVIGTSKITAAHVDEQGNGSPSLYGDFPVGARLRCEVDASDPDGDPLTIKWELREDRSTLERKFDPLRGYYEEPLVSFDGAVQSTQGKSALIQLPRKPDFYRIYVYVYDGKGNAATANYPLNAR